MPSLYLSKSLTSVFLRREDADEPDSCIEIKVSQKAINNGRVYLPIASSNTNRIIGFMMIGKVGFQSYDEAHNILLDYAYKNYPEHPIKYSNMLMIGKTGIGLQVKHVDIL